MRYPALRFDSGRFDENETRATGREFRIVSEMPVIHEAVDSRIEAHRRNNDAVRKLHTTNIERGKQARTKLSHAGCLRATWQSICESGFRVKPNSLHNPGSFRRRATLRTAPPKDVG